MHGILFSWAVRGTSQNFFWIGTVLIPNPTTWPAWYSITNHRTAERSDVGGPAFISFTDPIELRQLSLRAVARRHIYPPLKLDSRVTLLLLLFEVEARRIPCRSLIKVLGANSASKVVLFTTNFWPLRDTNLKSISDLEQAPGLDRYKATTPCSYRCC